MSESTQLVTQVSNAIRNIYPDATKTMCLSLTCGAIHNEKQRQLDEALGALLKDVSPESLRAALDKCSAELERGDDCGAVEAEGREVGE